MDSILRKMLARGDRVSIERGRLAIQPASGKPVPDDWLADNENDLIHSVLALAGADAYRYTGYKTGQYGTRKSEGVTLQMVKVQTGESRYAIFNVGLKRERNSKRGAAGTPLPKGRFIPPKGGDFAKLWKATGLPCKSLSEVCESMGRLREILLTGTTAEGERMNAKSLKPLAVSADTLRARATGNGLLNASDTTTSSKPTGKRPVSNRYGTGKEPVRPAGKETQQGHASGRLQPDSGTGANHYGNTVIRKYGYKKMPILSEADQEYFDKVWNDPEELEAAINLGWGDTIFGIEAGSSKY